jgi:hypothetical protein
VIYQIYICGFSKSKANYKGENNTISRRLYPKHSSFYYEYTCFAAESVEALARRKIFTHNIFNV